MFDNPYGNMTRPGYSLGMGRTYQSGSPNQGLSAPSRYGAGNLSPVALPRVDRNAGPTLQGYANNTNAIQNVMGSNQARFFSPDTQGVRPGRQPDMNAVQAMRQQYGQALPGSQRPMGMGGTLDPRNAALNVYATSRPGVV